ncbi:hypothetical protein ACFQ2B_00335 [Streptomyces stramineus]
MPGEPSPRCHPLLWRPPGTTGRSARWSAPGATTRRSTPWSTASTHAPVDATSPANTAIAAAKETGYFFQPRPISLF